MKLTKYEHACFAVEIGDKTLIIDPGAWTSDLPKLTNVRAVVITHEHPDHFDMSALESIFRDNPDVTVFAHTSITDQLNDAINYKSVDAGESIDCAPFNLKFFGGNHATIHESFDPVSNLGVMVNNAIYYPGDSFTLPNRAVKALALPVTAPWLKISEAIDFVSNANAELVFPTHDAIASDKGKQLADRIVPSFVEAYGGTYLRLTAPIEIDG